MRVGNYYEVVLRQTFSSPFDGSPSDLFRRVQKTSPSPYEFILQMGGEQLVGASPEMFVRVEGKRVETCPIAGTARRSGDPLRDAESIRDLLISTKEESELTMCTRRRSERQVPRLRPWFGARHRPAVDRIVRRPVPYRGPCEGTLAWKASIRSTPSLRTCGQSRSSERRRKRRRRPVEDLEKDARGWYGGAVGMLGLNGDINTGITIRTVHLKKDMARYPAGATFLYDSEPEQEEQECRLKATSFFRALYPPKPKHGETATGARRVGDGIHLLLVDNDDCFIHTWRITLVKPALSVSTYRVECRARCALTQ